jgi:cullin 1
MHFDKTGGISQLTQALLRQIESQRNGEEVNQTLMKGIVQSYGKLLNLVHFDGRADWQYRSG